MKHKLFLVLLLLVSIRLGAQNIELIKIEPIEKDQTVAFSPLMDDLSMPDNLFHNDIL